MISPPTTTSPSAAPGRTIPLPDGRHLGIYEHGDPTGRPLLLFHGLGACRLMRHPDESIARRLGVRVIGVDRPGLGFSDRQPGRNLLDWPTDVSDLADALALERFAVMGN